MFHQMFTVDFGTSFVLCEHRGKEQHKEIPFVGALLPLLVWRLFRILRGKELTGTEGQGYSVFQWSHAAGWTQSQLLPCDVTSLAPNVVAPTDCEKQC